MIAESDGDIAAKQKPAEKHQPRELSWYQSVTACAAVGGSYNCQQLAACWCWCAPIADSSGPGIASAMSRASARAFSTMSKERITPSRFCAGSSVPSGSSGEPSNLRAWVSSVQIQETVPLEGTSTANANILRARSDPRGAKRRDSEWPVQKGDAHQCKDTLRVGRLIHTFGQELSFLLLEELQLCCQHGTLLIDIIPSTAAANRGVELRVLILWMDAQPVTQRTCVINERRLSAFISGQCLDGVWLSYLESHSFRL